MLFLAPLLLVMKDCAILGIGACCIDTIADISSFPEPDDKIRALRTTVAGGGNAGNSMVAARRLGISCGIMTKLGIDANGKVLADEFEREGVDTSRVVYGGTTGSTYVVVDVSAQTRTCIHTPQTEELTADDAQKVSDNSVIKVLHSDSRHPWAALEMMKKHRESSVVTLDIEKERPGASELLEHADIVFTNSRFPAPNARNVEDLEAGMADLLARAASRARAVVSTRGKDGASIVWRSEEAARRDIDDRLVNSIDERGFVGGDGEYYRSRVLAWPPADSVVDTTGAGDALIGGALVGLAKGWPLERAVVLGSIVASKKITRHTARAGLPNAADIESSLREAHIEHSLL